jgi:hypothetical protein
MTGLSRIIECQSLFKHRTCFRYFPSNNQKILHSFVYSRKVRIENATDQSSHGPDAKYIQMTAKQVISIISQTNGMSFFHYTEK